MTKKIRLEMLKPNNAVWCERNCHFVWSVEEGRSTKCRTKILLKICLYERELSLKLICHYSSVQSY